MNIHAIEKALNEHYSTTLPVDGAMKVEQFGALAKRRGQFVLWEFVI
jgi:hypothetical protein